MSLATTTDAIEIEPFESALGELGLTEAQTVMIQSATHEYRRAANDLRNEKARMESFLVAHSGAINMDRIAEMIRVEARILTNFVALRRKVRTVLRASQTEALDAYLTEKLLAVRALAVKREASGSVAF